MFYVKITMYKFVKKGAVKTMENNYNKFRRAAIGGFNRQDVVNYIEKMKNEFFDYKKEVEKTIDGLNEKIKELEALADKYEEAVDESVVAEETVSETETNPVSDINEATLKLRMVADELCKSLCDFMDRVSENAVSVVIEKKTEPEIGELIVVTDDTEEAAESEDCEDAIEQTGEISDKVSSILKATQSFCCNSEDSAEAQTEGSEAAAEKRNILDILGGASFLK